MHFELHPLCTLFPRMSGAEFDALKADIVANGQNEAIVVHDGFILDGGNRYRACVETGTEPLLKEFTGANPASYVLSANLHRRHLTPGQQAAIVASAQDWSRAQGAGGDRKADQSATLHFDSVADRAAQSGASVRTQKMADKVAKASPEMARQVAHGEISLPKAIEQLAAPTAPTSAPAVLDPAPAEAANDQGIDADQLAELADALSAADAEIRRLELLVKNFTEHSDLAKQVDAWSLKFDQLSGRNAQLTRTCNEAQGQVRQSSDLLAKIRRALGVASNAEILPAIVNAKAAA